MDRVEEENLKEIQLASQRIFKSDDGKLFKQFLEHIAGLTGFTPSDNLELAEGLKRLNVTIHMMGTLKLEAFVKWWEETGIKICSK